MRHFLQYLVLVEISPHVLRHSFATHFMDHGTDTRIIQVFLGHELPKTIALYAYLGQQSFGKSKNPKDDILGNNALNMKPLKNAGYR